MIILDVVNELRAALATITGLNVPPWGGDIAKPPAAVIAMPDSIEFDASYRRGRDTIPDLQLIVIVDYQNSRSGFEAIAPYLDGSGPKSIKALTAAKNAATSWTSCDRARVTSVSIDLPTYKETTVVSATFHLTIVGKGITP